MLDRFFDRLVEIAAVLPIHPRLER
jgi:hypothetical protein